MSAENPEQNPTSTSPRKRARWPWWLYSIALLATIGVNLYVLSRERSLIGQRDQLRQQHQQQVIAATELDGLLDQVRSVANTQSQEVRELKQLFRAVKSREQFLVTTGDRVVWSMKRFTDRGERILWFYVPEGRHRLVYSIDQFLRDGYYARSAEVTTCDHRGLPETATVPVDAPSVYQLRVAIDPTDGHSIQVGLSGTGDKSIHDASYPLAYPARLSLGNLQNDSEDMMAYPGELKTAGDAKAHVTANKSHPVSAMMTLLIDDLGGRGKESKGRVVMRFWIDSGSVGCMSDVTVAWKYKFLSNMKQAFKPATQQDFEQMFKPYDGSGRYYCSDGYFPQATMVTGIDSLPKSAN